MLTDLIGVLWQTSLANELYPWSASFDDPLQVVFVILACCAYGIFVWKWGPTSPFALDSATRSARKKYDGLLYVCELAMLRDSRYRALSEWSSNTFVVTTGSNSISHLVKDNAITAGFWILHLWLSRVKYQVQRAVKIRDKEL